MIIGISHYIIIIALNSLTCTYIFSKFGSNNVDPNDKFNII